MIDLSTSYLGLKLKNPLVVSASPLSESIDNLQRMEEAGAAAIVLHSLFEEQIELENMGKAQHYPEMLPEELREVAKLDELTDTTGSYLAHIYQAKRAVNIPIIASLNGYYGGGWTQYARLIESAGADALELNLYYLPVKVDTFGSEIEEMYLDLVRQVKSCINIPIAVKISPYFSAMANMLTQFDKAGVNGLVLFNRFYQPDFDIETFTVEPSLSLSTPEELRLRLRWTALTSASIKADIAITGGVHRAQDVVKCLLAGATVAMFTSVLLKNGIPYLAEVQANLHQWLVEHEINAVSELIGRMSQEKVSNPSALERANYIRVLHSQKFE